MEANATLVRANGIVELYAITDIGLHFAVVISPCHTECQNTVRFDQTFDDACFFKFGMLVVDIFHAHQHLFNCLQILFLTGMLGLE